MKLYFLRLTLSDLTQEADKWVSDVVDLYDNNWYRNFSVTRSTYGLSGQKYVWAGLKADFAASTPTITKYGDESEIDAAYEYITLAQLDNQSTWGTFRTDSGLVDNGRFIDYSGQINVVSFNINEAYNTASLSLWTSDKTTDTYYTEEWESFGPFKTYEPLEMVDADRYAKIVLDFGAISPASDLEVWVRVEIGEPVIPPLYRSTQDAVYAFPEWTDIHERPSPQTFPVTREPSSVGGALYNAAAGEPLDEARSEILDREFNSYITTVDLNQPAWLYTTGERPDYFTDIEVAGVELARTGDYRHLLALPQGDDIATKPWGASCFISENEVVTLAPYANITIDGTVYELEPVKIYNYLDDLGARVDLPRYLLESNANYQKRILDVYINRPGPELGQVKRALRRELDLWKANGAVIDSEADTFLPEIYDIDDLLDDPQYFAPDGMATEAFIEFVSDLAAKHPTTWGRFVWDNALYDIAGENHEGVGLVPYRYDSKVPSDTSVLKPGVGYGQDLRLFRPDEYTGAKNYETQLVARGRQRTARTEYSGLYTEIEVTPQGTRDYYNNPEKTVYFTVEIGTTAGVYLHSFTLTAQSNVSVENATATADSYAVKPIFSEDGEGTSSAISFNDDVTNEPYGGTGVIPTADIQSVTLKQGKWEAGSYINLEVNDHYKAWFSSNPAAPITDAGAQSTTAIAQTDLDTVAFYGDEVIFESLLTSGPTPGTWVGDTYTYEVRLDGIAPYQAKQGAVINLPAIVWDPYTTARFIRVKHTLVDDLGNPTVISIPEADESLQLPLAYVDMNGLATWDAAGIRDVAEGTTTLTFSSVDGAEYPTTEYQWAAFEYRQTNTFEGLITPDGPYDQNNQPPQKGSLETLAYLYDSLTRADLGVPDDENYVVTSIDVERIAGDARVSVYLDATSVIPAGAEVEEYPANSIQEYVNAGVYYYDPVVLRARFKNEPTPDWQPQIHSGWYYQDGEEYYLYSEPKTVNLSLTTHTLDEYPNQGAPVSVIEGTKEFREVAFFDEDLNLTLTNTEYIPGNGSTDLYASYSDIYDITVVDPNGAVLLTAGSTVDNVIDITPTVTDKDSVYTVTYKVRDSYFIQRETSGASIHLDRASTAVLTYEGSDVDPATPVDLPLNPLYTPYHEGFAFISHNEYLFQSVQISMSPQRLSNENDYAVVTVEALDTHGNIKPSQPVTLTTTGGSLNGLGPSILIEGFESVVLVTDGVVAGSYLLEATVGGTKVGEVEFEIIDASTPKPRILASPDAETLQANGEDRVRVIGRVESAAFVGQAGVTVNWKRHRSIYQLFEAVPVSSGSVVTGSNGYFEIGPIISDTTSGYWFMALEATVGAEVIGEVVVWYEYPTSALGIEEGFTMTLPVQYSDTTDTYPDYYDNPYYPVGYEEDGGPQAGPAGSANWIPPDWYAMNGYDQYQLNIASHETSNDV